MGDGHLCDNRHRLLRGHGAGDFPVYSTGRDNHFQHVNDYRVKHNDHHQFHDDHIEHEDDIFECVNRHKFQSDTQYDDGHSDRHAASVHRDEHHNHHCTTTHGD